jgi:hypothetical protein
MSPIRTLPDFTILGDGEPSEKLPDQPIINTPKEDFETLVVEMPTARTASGKKPLMVAAE